MNFIQLKRNLKKRKRKINSCNFIKQLKKKLDLLMQTWVLQS